MELNIHHHHPLQSDDPVVQLILAKLTGIFSRMDTTMVDITKLTSDVAALSAAIQSVDTDLSNLRAEIKTLSAQVAAGGGVTQAQIDALDTQVASAITNLNTQVGQDTQPAPAPAAALTTDKPV